MLSLSQIRAMARRAAARAAQEGRYPFLVEAEDIADYREGAGFPFPFLGTHVPHGWKKVRAYFVDSSGFGAPGEPALTASQFIERLVVGRGYAITEAGQFQVYVGEFVPTPANGHRQVRKEV